MDSEGDEPRGMDGPGRPAGRMGLRPGRPGMAALPDRMERSSPRRSRALFATRHPPAGRGIPVRACVAQQLSIRFSEPTADES
jgi:hypothetical protein